MFTSNGLISVSQTFITLQIDISIIYIHTHKCAHACMQYMYIYLCCQTPSLLAKFSAQYLNISMKFIYYMWDYCNCRRIHYTLSMYESIFYFKHVILSAFLLWKGLLNHTFWQILAKANAPLPYKGWLFHGICQSASQLEQIWQPHRTASWVFWFMNSLMCHIRAY